MHAQASSSPTLRRPYLLQPPLLHPPHLFMRPLPSITTLLSLLSYPLLLPRLLLCRRPLRHCLSPPSTSTLPAPQLRSRPKRSRSDSHPTPALLVDPAIPSVLEQLVHQQSELLHQNSSMLSTLTSMSSTLTSLASNAQNFSSDRILHAITSTLHIFNNDHSSSSPLPHSSSSSSSSSLSSSSSSSFFLFLLLLFLFLVPPNCSCLFSDSPFPSSHANPFSIWLLSSLPSPLLPPLLSVPHGILSERVLRSLRWLLSCLPSLDFICLQDPGPSPLSLPHFHPVSDPGPLIRLSSLFSSSTFPHPPSYIPCYSIPSYLQCFLLYPPPSPPVLLFNVYLPPSGTNPTLSRTIFSSLTSTINSLSSSTHFVIMGDFNSRVQSFDQSPYDRLTNANGRLLLTFLNSVPNLCRLPLSPLVPTRISLSSPTTHSSFIDYILLSSSLTPSPTSAHVILHNTALVRSDHRILHCSFPLPQWPSPPPSYPPPSSPLRWRFTNLTFAHWNRFRVSLAPLLHQWLSFHSSLSTADPFPPLFLEFQWLLLRSIIISNALTSLPTHCLVSSFPGALDSSSSCDFCSVFIPSTARHAPPPLPSRRPSLHSSHAHQSFPTLATRMRSHVQPSSPPRTCKT